MGAADRPDVCLGLYRVISWVPGLSSSVRLLNGQPTPAAQGASFSSPSYYWVFSLRT